MPLTYEEFRTKRDNILYRNEFTMTVVPVLTYLSAGMQAVADKLGDRSPRQADAFRQMREALRIVSGESDREDYTDRQISDALEQVNGLYAFLDQQTGDTANRRLLEDALAENPGWKDAYLRTDDAKNASLQQNLDAVGDFFVTSRRAIDEQMDRNRREARVLAAEERRRQAAERIETR